MKISDEMIRDYHNNQIDNIPERVNSLISFDPTIVEDLSAELIRAREKFPSGYNLTVALIEEVGELASAQMQNLGKQKIRKEAIQVMAMAVRIIEEGDHSIYIDNETIQK